MSLSGFDQLNPLKKAPVVTKKSTYDPEPKRSHRHLVEWIMAFLGIGAEVAPFIMAKYLWKTQQDLLRDQQTEIIKAAELSTTKDWVIEDETACDYCQAMAAGSPYPIDYDADTHPNCRCSWLPHVE
jgi:hypothetical protein